MSKSQLVMAMILATAFPLTAAGTPAAMVVPLTQCHTLLSGVSTTSQGNFEFQAVCRAQYPTHFCRDAVQSLGEQPWPPAAIDKTCQGWAGLIEARVSMMSPERAAMTYKELQETLDKAAREKAKYGYEIPRDENGQVDLDKTAEQKLKQTKIVSAALSEHYNTYLGGGAQPSGSRVHDDEDGAWVQAWSVNAKEIGAPSRSSFVMWFGSVVSAAGMGAAVTLLAQRVYRAKKSQHGELLVPEQDEIAMAVSDVDGI